MVSRTCLRFEGCHISQCVIARLSGNYINTYIKQSTGIIYSGSAGRTGLDKHSSKFDGDSLTYAASLTKLLSSTCLLHLVEQDKISLDSNMRQLVPELNKMQILRGFTPEGQPILEDNERPMTLK
jgi:CubicO group peptidase (beta-lactamase class C family)